MSVAFSRNTRADTPKTRNWSTKNIKESPKTLGEALMSLLIFTVRGMRYITPLTKPRTPDSVAITAQAIMMFMITFFDFAESAKKM